MRKTPLMAATAIAILLCASCSQASTGGSEKQPVISSPAVSRVPPSLSANGGPQAQPSANPTVTKPTWAPGDEDAAKKVALEAMTDFARPRVDKTRWANDFARWLAPQATADYSGVDPANVPVSKITGPPTLTVDKSNGFGVIAAVPTNIGTYTVQLLRASQEAPWKVNRITPPV